MNIITQAMADSILDKAREDERKAARDASFELIRSIYHNDMVDGPFEYTAVELDYLHACAIVDDLERES